MSVANGIAILVGALIISEIARALSPGTKASYGAVFIAAVAGGLVMYAACINFTLPKVVTISVKGETVHLFWILMGNLWAALLGTFVAGGRADKGSGVR